MDCSPNELIAQAKCLACLGPAYLREVQLSLLCAWLNATKARKGGS